MLYLYQSDIYYIEQNSDDTIMIYTNDGREIEIKATTKNESCEGKLEIITNENE